MMRGVCLMLAGSLAWIACGGSDAGFSGVESTKEVDELSGSEMRDLCAWTISYQGGEGATFECADGVSVTNDTVEECVDEQYEFAGCTLTVRQMEECVLAAGPDPCRVLDTPECAPFIACVFGRASS